MLTKFSKQFIVKHLFNKLVRVICDMFAVIFNQIVDVEKDDKAISKEMMDGQSRIIKTYFMEMSWELWTTAKRNNTP